jgi:hypothetical protein
MRADGRTDRWAQLYGVHSFYALPPLNVSDHIKLVLLEMVTSVNNEYHALVKQK